MNENMKKIIFAISALAVLAGVSTSCEKELSNVQENTSSKEFTITATIADNSTKVSYAENSSYNLKPSWQVNDIVVGFDDSGNTYGFEVTAVNDGKAILTIITSGDNVGSETTVPADGTKMYMIYAPGKKPSDISSKSLTVNIANQDKDVVPALMMASAEVADSNLSLEFENKTCIIGIKSPVMAVASTAYTSIELSGSGINTEVVFSLSGDTLQATYQTAGTITKNVEFTSSSSKVGPDAIYIVACPLSTSADLTFTASNWETFTKTGKTMTAGNYYYMTPTFSPGVPDGPLSGKFSVASDKQVYFSPGNLIYRNGFGNFESHQYDFHTLDTGTNTFGLFGWSSNKSGNTYGAITKANSNWYIGTYIEWGNLIKNTYTWRTLSNAEWVYLLNTRTVNGGTGKGKSYSLNVTYGGVMGMILYPDDYTSDPISGTVSTIPDGVVFLPAAGHRNSATYKDDAGSEGYYWTSTKVSDTDYNYIRFTATALETNIKIRPFNGLSVRLVTNVE